MDLYKIKEHFDNEYPKEACGILAVVKGKKEFVVMIALSFANKILQSWIYKPLTEDMMYACLNEGTFYM